MNAEFLTICPYCDRALTGRVNIAPEPGGYAVCRYCRRVIMVDSYNGSLVTRRLTVDENRDPWVMLWYAVNQAGYARYLLSPDWPIAHLPN